MTASPRFGAFTVRTDCRHCGQPLPLNEPTQRAHCSYCANDVDVPDALWSQLLVDFDDAYDDLPAGTGAARSRELAGLTIHGEYKRSMPACEKCGNALQAERIEDGANKDFWCVSCGDPASTFAAPAWLRALVPTAVQIFSTDPGAGPGNARGAVARAPEDAPRPVVMPCPQCGGSLRITHESARTVPCEFCKTDVYLPDDLWRRLHPAKLVRTWYVRFEGPSRHDLLRAAAERKAAEREERERVVAMERAAQQEADAIALDAEIARLVKAAYLWVLVACGAMFACLAWIGVGLSSGPVTPVTVGVAAGLAAAGFALLVVSLAMAGRPVQRRTRYDGTAMMFVVWFFAIFGFVMPVVGQVMVLAVAAKRFMGTLGGNTITVESGGGQSSKYYPKIQMEHGETRPLGVAYLALGLLWPAMIFGLYLLVH